MRRYMSANSRNLVKTSLLFLYAFLLLISSCTTHYVGRVPDFNKKVEERDNEYEKFRFKEGYWNQYMGAFTMGADETLYTMKSLRPVIEKVDSQAFNDELKKADTVHKVGLGLLGAALLVLITDTDVEGWSSTKKTAYWSLLGLSVAGSYVSFHFINNASKAHNNDLRKKLDLGLKATFNY